MSGVRAGILVQGLALCLLGMAGVQAALVAGQAPAVTESLRTQGITGETRTLNIAAMYSLSDYLFQTAVGFANADAFSFSTIEAPDMLATDAAVGERAARAANLMSQAVRLDPGNAHKWFVLAQALAGAGRGEEALWALEQSQKLSPTMPRLAYQRVWLFWALFEALDGISATEGAIAQYRSIYMADRPIALKLEGQQEPLPPL